MSVIETDRLAEDTSNDSNQDTKTANTIELSDSQLDEISGGHISRG